ncbi:MAG TPA: tetratricopeptide repeat protein [Roseiflexaceae bacterium]
MSSQALIALLLLLVLVALAALPSVRAFFARQRQQLRRQASPPPRPRASIGVTIITGDGEEFDPPDEQPGSASWRSRVEAFGSRQRLITVLLVGLLTLLGAIRIYWLVAGPGPEQFVVLVAPFQERGNAAGQTGREVASALVAQLPRDSGGRVFARLLDQPPADTQTALNLLQREGADALITGEIEPGGMLDRESLTPLLIYQPSGPFAPNGWEWYAGRFAMPTAYELSGAPINGAVILPDLLGALADYNAGKFDSAFNTLGKLADDYPALAPALPRALRGNILWARGEYQDAKSEYNRALRGLAPDSAGSQAALLYNNLGAILQDAGDASAQSTFDQAITALGGRDLSALRYNLGLQALRAGNPADAATALAIASNPNLLPPSTPSTQLLLALGEAYRLSHHFDQAKATLDAAPGRMSADVALTTTETRNLTSSRLNAALAEQRALLALAQAVDARGPLPWEIDASAPLPATALNSARETIAQSADDTQVLAQRWARLAVSKDAAGAPIAGQIATHQSQRARALLRERQRWQAGIAIERERAQGVREPRGLAAIWAGIVGDRSPLGQARTQLQELLKTQPGDVDSLLLLGRTWLLVDNVKEAGPPFDQAAAAAPQRPEPVYDQAQVALPTDRARGVQLLQRAISLNPLYFPARMKLAMVAQEDGDWATAIAQRRWLAENRPSKQSTLALAETLQSSGPSGYAEAEQTLLQLANSNDLDALFALSKLYQARGDTQAAQAILERAALVAPADPKPHYELGLLLEHQKDMAGAEAEYRRALDLDPRNIDARLALGKLYTDLGRTAEAAAQYSEALRAGAKDPAALKQIGIVLLANGEYDTAATALERAIAANDADPELHHNLAQANLKRNRLDAAEKEERRALELRPNYPEALVGLGDIALQRGGNPQAAVDQYNAAIKLDSRLVDAYIGLGRASGAAGNWSVAEAHFRDAVNIKPDSPVAHLWLGEALVRKPDPAAAIVEYSQAIELKQNSYPEGYFGLAQAQMVAGQNDLAQQNVASALLLRPSYPEALLLQGKLYEQQGDDDAAIRSYSKAIDTSAALAEPRYRRALLYMRRDRLDDAAGDLQAAIKIQPNFSEAHYWLGRVYLAEGRPKQARDELLLAIQYHNGGYAEAQFYLGMAEEQLGLRNDAVASYQAALAQNSGGEWAGDARTAIDRLTHP